MQAVTKERRGASSRIARSVVVPSAVHYLTQTVDVGLAGMLLVAPLFMGGRGPVGQFVFVLLACLTAVCYLAKQVLIGQARWRWSGVEWLLMLGAALVILQLTPLPQSLLLWLSPSIGELLPLWVTGSATNLHFGEWSTLSLTVDATRSSLSIYVAYVLFFLLLVQRLAKVEDIGLLLRVVAAAAMLMALLGLTQFFFSNGKFLWVYTHPSRSTSEIVRGAFQNQNHFAHFLSLGLGPTLWWLWHSWQTDSGSKQSKSFNKFRKRIGHRHSTGMALQSLVLIGLVLIALAGLLTLSRGGVLTMGIALVIWVSMMRWKSLINRRTTAILLTVAAIDFMAMVLFGYDSLFYEIHSVFRASSLQELSHGRVALWNALFDGIEKFPLLGTGIGSHSEVYPIYMKEFYNAEFTHGESGYLPLLLEAGVCGLALVLTGIAISFFWCLRALTMLSKSYEARNGSASSAAMLVSCVCGIAPSLLASVIHSIADFVWYIPGCMVMTIAQLACTCRLYQLSRKAHNASAQETESSHPDTARYSLLPRWACLALTLALLLTTTVMAKNLLGPALGALDWDAYLKHSIVRNGAVPQNSIQETERLDAMERHLVALVRHSPQNARAHLRLAAVYLKQFELRQRSAENSMDLSQIRDAALASAFPSKASQDAWLDVAIGDSRHLLELAQTHSRRAVQLSPLQGIGYIQLAELSFLDSPRESTKYAYIDQAARVRPHSGQVLFTLGKEAALAGNLPVAFQHWKRAFQRDPEIRQVMINSLADQIPCELFVSSFEPDTQTSEQLFQHYQAKGRIQEARFVGLRLANRLQQDAQTKSSREAASHWRRAQETFTWLGDNDKALHCQRNAVGLAPLDFDSRRTLARLLTKQHHYPEAIEQFEWCVRRQPDDKSLRNELADLRILQVSSTQIHVAEKSVRP